MNVNGFLTKQVRTPIWRRLKTPTKRIITTLGTILLLITGLNYRMMAQDCVTLPPNQQKSCSISKDGTAVDFTVTGRMPAHARVSVTPVERDDEEGNPMLAAYDITLTDSHNQEWQPAYGQPAQVTITDPAFGNGRKLDIFHETEEGREYVTTVVSANNTVTFPAKHFSVYVIGTPNGKNRMVVAFVKTLHNDAYSSPDSLRYDTLCMLVKRADTIYNGKFMSRLVYPPNPGYIPEGVNFFGWSRTPDYTADPESRMTIDVVRELVYDRLKNGEEITKDLGDTMMFYSVLLKAHTINYRSLRNPNVVIGVDEVLYLRNDNPVQDYIVNESYIPTAANANFQGWLLIEGDSNVVDTLPDNIYPNGTSIKIKGDITFMEELAYGYWLVFNENGKGASYTAPKFLKSNDVGIAGDTLSEAEPDYPTRYGYNFGGWYADPTFDTPFVFKGYLNQDTIIHAKWVTKERAFYTIIVWRQNVARNGYDFAESFSLEGKVGYSIASQAIETGKEGDLDYVIVGGDTLGGIKSVPNGQESDPYTGFTLSTVNPIVDQAVTTDGKAVVNIYFDRMKYNLRLYVVRTNAKGDGDYKGTSIGKSLNPEAPDFLGNWSSGNIVSLSGFPQLFGSNPHFYDVSGSYRYYYDTITAYYGENIRNRWPTHEKITVSGSNYFISWFLMSGAKAFVGGANGTGNGTGGNTLKGEVNIMDEQILGRLDKSDSNLLLARYATTFCPTTFYYYFHDVNGNPPDEPSDTVITRAGENNYTYLMDKGPSFEGYTYDKNASDGLNYKYHGQNKDSAYVLNYHYRRKAYSITFRDGVYLDGNGDELQNNSSNTPLRIMTGVKYGANIDTLNSYEPTLPLTEEGFVFDGWYMDDACSRRYEFDKMPMGNLVVYARWRQIQYRVFLHPQAGKDPSLNWGNASQAMNFRISYGGKVSAPTGQRDLYEFGGWYLDSTYQNRYFAEVSTLTEQTVTTPYVKNVDMTDNMDKWGVVHNPDTFPYVAYNSDTIVINNNGDIISNKDTVDRFWITKKLDLYARWRHKLDGAEGVKVQYFCDSCEASSMPRPDNNLYLDKSKMVAGPAATSAFHNKIFAYWVLQNWNPTKGRFVDSLDANGKPVFVYPGGPYTLHLPYTWRKQTGDSAVYVYQLRAELESYKDNHTFIVWYRNWGKPDGDTVRYDPPDTLTINMMVTIPYPNEVGEREGYIYKGWHKEGYGPEGSGQESTFEARLLGDTTTVNSLWYNPEDGQYYSKDYTTLAPDSLEFYRAYGVGADEVTPYDYFYAVWEPIQYTIRFHQNTDDPIVTGTMEDQVFKYDERKNLSKIGYLYKCHKFLGWAMSPDGEVVYENQEEILNLTSENGKIFDLYAKWVEESHNLVVSPDSATCLSPGSIGIRLDGVSMPNYTYSVIELDTTDTPYGTADTVWQHVSSGTHIVAHHIVHGLYRVEVVTGSQCVVYKDTAVFLNPVEVPWDNPIETVCSGSPFVIKPSTNDDVRYLWDAPTKSPGAVVIPDTANNNDPQEYILCTISNNDGSPVSYTIHAILGNCELGDVPTTINVSSAELGPFTINLSSLTDTLCSGTSLDVTASVNENIYNKDSYKLNWIFKGDTISSTETGHSPTVIQQLTMPDTCRGDFSVEVYYADVTECHVNAVKNFKVRIKDWEGPERKDSTIHCVKDAVAPHTIKPSIMPVVKDGCGNTLEPIMYDTLVDPVDLSCDGTVTYIYEYEDCDGEEKYWDFVYHVDKQAPEIAITSIPDPTPIGACQYRIPAIGYELTDCDPSLVTVTQTPSATDHIRQIDKDSVVTITLTAADKCGDTATVTTTVTIPARPTVTPTAEKPEFCLGDTTRVTAATTGTSSASVITWSATPSTGEFIYDTVTTFTATTHDPYTLTATVVENGCLATGETSVTVKPSAELTVTNQNQTTCFGASISNVYITLLYTDNLVTSGDLPAGVTFHSENNGYVISGTPTQAGVFKYYLTASSQDPSCGVTKDSVSIEISPFTEGTVSISGDTVFCEGKSTTLRVKQNAQSNAKSYTWANSNGILPYTKSYLTVVEPGTYSVTVTSLEGCISTGSQIVTRNPRPSVELVLPSPICPEDNVQQLQANITDEIQKPEYTYYWTTGKDAAFNGTEHLATPTLTMLVPENCKTISYPVTLILEDSSGCQKTVSDSILMRNVPPTITRKTESITLSPNAYCQYFIPNEQALDTLVDISGNCTRTEDLSTSIFYPSANVGNIITSTDSITITVTDACNHSARTKIEVKIPEGMPVQERDSLVLNSFEWEGITHTESTTVESEDNNIGHSCSIDRANITVLHTNKTDTAICEGGTTNLIVNVDRPVLPAVGDVLCLKGTAAPYDTLVLRPDTFLARATADALTPIGVVFYVDPNDNSRGKALALVDAVSGTCQWANINNNNVTDGNANNNSSHLKAAYDINGYSNTANMIATAAAKNTNAPAANYCYHYNPLTKSGTDSVHFGWYLPAAGELSMYFAQRIQVNKTLQKLSAYSATIPLVDYVSGSLNLGYWSSTDYNNSQAEFVNQTGQYSNTNKTSEKNVRAVFSYHSSVSQMNVGCKVGDLISFKGGSKGVICYVDPNNPYKGWAAALHDLNNSDNESSVGKYMLQKNSVTQSLTNFIVPWPDDGGADTMPNYYTGFGKTELIVPSGMDNTLFLFQHNSGAAEALNNNTVYKLDDGWYIPDMVQLRLWYALFPVIKNTVENNGGKLPNSDWGTAQGYWSSTGTKKANDFGRMQFPDGKFRSNRGTNPANLHHVRPVRDFDLTVSWDDDTVASANPLADTMQVSPSATQKYYATVKFCGWTLRDSATVIVATKPKITAKNDTADRLLGCNPASIPIMTVDSFTVEDNSKPDAKVSLTRRDTSGIERSLTWTATYQNQCGQNADTVRVTYRWCELSVKAKDSTKVFDGEALPATFVCTPSGTTPTVRYKVKNGDTWSDYTTDIPSITHAGSLTYLVEVISDNCNCTVSDTATLTITPKQVTVTAKSEEFTYDGTAHSNDGYDVVGLVGDDAISAVVTGSITFPSESPVTNTVGDCTFTTGIADNYTVTKVNGQLTMTNAEVAITITAASDEWTYDGDAHQNTTVAVTEGTLFEGDELVATATGSVTNVSDTQEGNNPIATGYKIMHGEEDVTANYTITTVAGKLTINPRAVTVTAQDNAFVYTGEAQSWPEYDVDGLIGSDAITAVVTGSITFPNESPVTNELTSYEFTSGTADNYTVTTVDGELTMAVADKEITITAASQAWTYDGSAHSNDTVKVTSGTLFPGDSLVATTTDSVKNVSETAVGNNPIAEGYKIMHGTVDVTANYVITANAGTLTINPTPVTVTANSEEFTYDGNAHSNSGYEVIGLVGNDAINAVVTGSIKFVSESPVTNVLSSYEFTSGTAGNYSVTKVNGQLTMTKASVPITITAASQSWTYDGIGHKDTIVTVTEGTLFEGDQLVATAAGHVTNVVETNTGNNTIEDGYKVKHNYQDVTENYVITPVAGTLTINPKPVTVTAKSEEFTYDGTAHSNSGYDVVGLVGNDAISAVVTGSITFPTQNPVTNKLTSYQFTTGTPGNYSVTTANGQLTMATADRAITITAASGEWTYDGSAHSNTAVTVTSGTLLAGDALVATATGSVTNVADNATDNNPIAAGYKIMHDTVDVTANYTITPVAGTLTINKKAVTVKAQDKEFTYTGEAQSWPEYDVIGLVGNDSIKAVVEGSIKFLGDTVPNEVKSYSFKTGTSDNYIVTTTDGQLTMTKASVAITITAASEEWTYDGVAHHNTTVTLTSGNLLTDDYLEAQATGSVTNVADNAEGNNPIADGYKIMHGTQDVSANYVITAVAGKLTINPRPVTVTAQNESFFYTGEAQSWPEYDVDGLVGNDAISAVVTGSITFPNESPVTNVLTSYQFTAGTPGNYKVTTANGQLTMTKASVPITITAASDAWTYDGSAHSNTAVTVTSGSLLPGDALVANATGSVTNVSETAVGNNPIASGYKVMHGTEDVTENYAIVAEAGKLTINPQPVTVTAKSEEFTYDGNAHSNSGYEVIGLVGDDAITAVVTGSIKFPSEDTVTNTLTSYTFTTGTPGNYSVITKNGKLTMTKASVPITITAASQSWTYDGNAHTNSTVTVTSGNLLTGDELVATAAGSVTNVADTHTDNNPIAEGYKVMHNYQDVTENYVITPVAGTLTINPKPVTVKAQDKTFAYTGEAQSWPKYDVEGLVGNDSISAVVTGTITFPSQGTVTNKLTSYEFITGTLGNYNVTTVDGVLKMAEAGRTIITITAASRAWTYDGTAHADSAVTVTSGSLLAGDSLVAKATGSVTNVADNAQGNNLIVPGYKVMRGDEDVTAKYAITTQAGTLTINPAQVTVTAQDTVFTYTGEAQSWPKYDVEGLVGNDSISAVVTGTITFPSQTVTNTLTGYAFVVGDAENYSVTKINGELTMTHASAAITITAASQAWTYDGIAHIDSTVTVTSGGLFSGDKLVAKATGSVTNVADTHTGNNPIAEEYMVKHGYQDVTANYVITTQAGTLTINPKTVTVTAQDKEFVYTGETQSWPKYDVDGLVGNDSISAVVTGSITFPTQGTVTNKLTSYEFITGTPGNYTVTTVDGVLKMAEADRTITITAASRAWTYDGTAHADSAVTVTSGSLLAGDSLVAKATGSVTNVMQTATGNNPIADGFKIMHGTEDVTANYAITTKSGTLTINPAPVTVTANSPQLTYDGKAQSDSGYVVQGLLGNDSIRAVVTGIITFPGQSPVTNTLESYSFITGDANNYSVTKVNGELKMTNAAVAITLKAASGEWTYDGSAHTANVVTLTNGSLLTGDELVATTTGSVTNVSDTCNNQVATFMIKHGTQNVTANYVVTTDTGTLTINPKAVTVRAKSQEFTYDGLPHSNSGYDVVGLVGNDSISAVVTGAITFPSESPVTNKLTSYEFTHGTSGNYNVTTVDGSLMMTTATRVITITAASGEWTYDGTAHSDSTVTVTSGSLLAGDSLVAKATGSVTNVVQTATGNNPIAAGYKVMHGTEDVTSNYVITANAGTLTINPTQVTVTANSPQLTYDGKAQSDSGYVVQGLVGNDAISAVVTGSITFPGQSPVTNTLASYSFIVGDANNYSVTTANGNLMMTNASVAITLTAASGEWTYDGSAHTDSTVTVTSGGLFSGDKLVAKATGSVTNVADTHTGNNPIAEGYMVKHGYQDVTANYVVTTESGTLIINPKAVTVKAQNKAFVYAGSTHSWPEYDVNGLVGNDSITAVVTGSITFPSESPVTNELTSYQFTAGTLGNYKVTTANGQLTMAHASVPITITAASQSWTYDGTAHSNSAVTVTSGSLLTGDSLVATATGSVTNVAQTATGNNPVASGYKVMHGTEDVTANYVITPKAGTLAITTRTVTVSVEDKTVEYNGSIQGGNTAYTFENVLDGQTATISYAPSHGTLVNTYDNGNYTSNSFKVVDTSNNDVTANYTLGTQTAGKLTITDRTDKYEITVVANSNTGNIYDGTTKSATGFVTLNFNVAGHNYTVSGLTTSNPSSANVCELTNAISGTAVVKDVAGNDVTSQFVVNTTNGTLKITPRTVTVSVANKTVEYNGALQNGNTTCTFENVVAGQTATIGYTAANGLLPSETPYDNSSYDDNFTVMAGTTDVTSNYILSTRTPGNLTIRNRTQKFPITVQSNSSYGNVYDGSVKSASGFQTLSFTFNNNTFTVSGLTTSDPSHSEVCDLPNAISGTAKVTDAHNHDVTEQFNVSKLEGRLTIQKRPVTVSVADTTVNYNGSLQYGHTASTFNNVVNGQTATIGYTASSGIMVSTVPYDNGNYGSNFQVMSGETNDVTSNYTLTLMKKGKLKIDPAPLTVTAKDSTKTYDGMALQASFTFESNESQPSILYKVKNGDTWSDYTTDLPSITNAGSLTYLVEASIATYTTTDTATLTITKRDVHLTSMDSTRIYNGDTLRYDSVKVTGNGFVNGEGATYQVTGSQLLPGTSHNTFTYALKSNTSAANYHITTNEGTLTVTNRPAGYRYPITVTSNSNPVVATDPIIYDGLKHTASDFVTLTFTTEDGHPYTVTGLTANVSGFDAGTYPNTIHGDTTVLDEHGNDVTAQFDIQYEIGKLVITKRPITITVPNEHATMMYNGDSLRVDYENIDISTLADRDTLKSGYVISEGYTIGTYHCNDNMFMATTGVASQHDFNIVHGATEEYAAGNSMANYRPRFNVTLTITKRPLEITASSAEKVYDGNPLTLTESDYTLTGGTSIAPSDTLIITRSGAQTCVGESANHITSVTILHKDDGVDVTYCYNISTVDGLIKVTAANAGLTSPETLNITLGEGTYDTLVPQSLLGMPSHDLLDAGVASVSNDLDEHNPLAVGTHTIKWILYDTCHTAMDSCYQTVVVAYSQCVGVTYHNHFYDAKRIGQQCWMTENLRNEIDAAGNPIANYHTFMDDTNHLHKFGYLYTWNSAVGVPENSTAAPQTFTGDDGQPFVQGICPAGWAVPTEADYSELQLFVGDAMLLKDAGEGYWVPGNGGTLPNSGFNARGGGFFNSAANRYEGILSDYWAWTSDFNAGGVTATSANISYYCNAMTFVEANKTDRRSVRCIRKVYDGQ